jgi:hypothetical protein
MAADPHLRFVLIEIELGITLVQSALTSYGLGFDEHGDSAKANAIKALETARRFIGDLAPEDQQIARAELPKLEQALADCPISGREDFS